MSGIKQAEKLPSNKDHEEDSIVQLAADIRNKYSDIDIDIKPTQISMTMLLTYASRLKSVLNQQVNHNSRDGKTPNKEQTSTARRRSRRKPRVIHRHMYNRDNTFVRAMPEMHTHSSRIAETRSTSDVSGNRRNGKVISMKSRADSPSCDGEIIEITSKIVRDYRQQNITQANHAHFGATNSALELSSIQQQLYCPRCDSPKAGRPHSWHVNESSSKAKSISQNFPNGNHQRSSSGGGRYSAGIHRSSSGGGRYSAGMPYSMTDNEAKMISDTYRLMTTTNSRLSSVDGTTTTLADDYSDGMNRFTTSPSQIIGVRRQQQPVLGLIQRHRKSKLRRQTIHGIGGYQPPCPAAELTRSSSDSMVSELFQSRPLYQYQKSSSQQYESNSRQRSCTSQVEKSNGTQTAQQEHHKSTSPSQRFYSAQMGQNFWEYSAQNDCHQFNQFHQNYLERQSHGIYEPEPNYHHSDDPSQSTHNQYYSNAHQGNHDLPTDQSVYCPLRKSYMAQDYANSYHLKSHAQHFSSDEHERQRSTQYGQSIYQHYSDYYQAVEYGKPFRYSDQDNLDYYLWNNSPRSRSCHEFYPHCSTDNHYFDIHGYYHGEPDYAEVFDDCSESPRQKPNEPENKCRNSGLGTYADRNPGLGTYADMELYARWRQDYSEEIWKHENGSLCHKDKLTDDNNNDSTNNSLSQAVKTNIHSQSARVSLKGHAQRRAPTHSRLPPPRSSKHRQKESDSENKSLVSVQAVPVSTASTYTRSRLAKPVKRTTSMPSHMQQPTTDYRYGQSPRHHVNSETRSVNAPPCTSQRPGRGVFTNSGRRVHEGQKQNVDNPPRLPARNPSPIRNGERSLSRDRTNVTQQPRRGVSLERGNISRENPFGKPHINNPNLSHVPSNSGNKPIDHLRNRVKMQQQKEQQRLANQSTSPTIDSRTSMERKDDSLHRHRTLDHLHQQQHNNHFRYPAHNSSKPFGPSHRVGRNSKREENDDVNDLQGFVTSEVSRSPTDYKSRKSPERIFPYSTHTPNSDQTTNVMDRSKGQTDFTNMHGHSMERSRPPTRIQQTRGHVPRIHTPERSPVSKTNTQKHEGPTNVNMQSSNQHKKFGVSTETQETHVIGKPYVYRRSVSPSKRTEPPPSSNLPLPHQHTQSTSNNTNSSKTVSVQPAQQRKAITALDYSDGPKPLASNKYKMLVCPDFFPVSKLNGIPGRRKSRAGDFPLVDEVFVDPPVPYFENLEEDGFYSKRTSHKMPVRPIVQLDDSFVEDPCEQFLYPSKNPKSQSGNSTEFYFDTSPGDDYVDHMSQDQRILTVEQTSPQVATEGDSLFSLHVAQSALESGASLQSSRTSTGSESSYTKFSRQQGSAIPPPYHQAVNRSYELGYQGGGTPTVNKHQTEFQSRNPLQHKKVQPNLPLNGLQPTGLSSAISDEFIQFEQEEVQGQRGQTATVIAHIEPVESEEGSHYSAVHLYRNMENSANEVVHSKQQNIQSRPPWEQEQSSTEKSFRHEERMESPQAWSHNSRTKSVERHNPSQSVHPSQFRSQSGTQTRLYTSRGSSGLPKPKSHASGMNQALDGRSKHSMGNLRASNANDDALLERIKAQSSPQTPDFQSQEHQQRHRQRQPLPSDKDQNIYENLNDLRTSVEKSAHNNQSFTNPDYCYPPALTNHSQFEKHIHSQPQLRKPSNSQLQLRRPPNSQSQLRKPSNIQSQLRKPTNQSQIERHSYDVRQQLKENHSQFYKQPQPTTVSQLPSQNTSARIPSVRDSEEFEMRKAVNFVEPPKQYVQSDYHVAEETQSADESQSSGISPTDDCKIQLPDNTQNQPTVLSEELTPEQEEIARLMNNLAAESGSSNESRQGLGEDILSITRMWKNLPANDSWTEKRKALHNDPIMSAITEKMGAILQANEESEKAGKSRTISVRNEPMAFEPHVRGQQSPQSPSDVSLVMREPGEGSSDDLDESIDLSKMLKHRQSHEHKVPNHVQSSIPVSQSKPSKHNNPHTGMSQSAKSSKQSSYRFSQQSSPSTTSDCSPIISSNTSKQTFSPNPRADHNANNSSRLHDGVVEAKHVTLIDPQDLEFEENLFTTVRESKMEVSESDESMAEEDDDDFNAIEATTSFKQEESEDDSDDQLAENTERRYLSDYHKMKAKPNQRTQSKKKISFSTDAKRSRPGDLIPPNQSETLLSINPFMTSSSLPLEKSSSNTLLSVNPFMADDDNSDTENNTRGKPKHGILKRSEESGGSQLSLTTCSEFGSHISLDSGLSRAGSFPLLTMSDGSKKDFRITFNDADMSDMGNLFKVAKKARSEGAASEPESTDSDSDDDAMPIVCKNCHDKQPLFKARLIYKMCHGCHTYYCSSDCRRQNWTAHKPLCIVSRLSSLARKIFKCVMTDQELLHHCSRFARTGYLCEGRGAVVLSFASPRKAQLFLSNAKQAKESALYLCIKDLQKFSFDDKRDKEQLLANCKHYNPDDKFVLHLAIKMNKSLSGQIVEPRIRGREFHKWARIRLSEKHNVPKGDRFNEEDTLILTALSGSPDQSTQDSPDPKSREVFFATVLTKLRKRGISLRHQYPEVYNALCQYVTSGKAFVPISLFAFNLNTQKRFMCCIMPYSDPDVTWGNNPHLMEDLDLAVTF